MSSAVSPLHTPLRGVDGNGGGDGDGDGQKKKQQQQQRARKAPSTPVKSSKAKKARRY